MHRHFSREMNVAERYRSRASAHVVVEMQTSAALSDSWLHHMLWQLRVTEAVSLPLSCATQCQVTGFGWLCFSFPLCALLHLVLIWVTSSRCRNPRAVIHGLKRETWQFWGRKKLGKSRASPCRPPSNLSAIALLLTCQPFTDYPAKAFLLSAKWTPNLRNPDTITSFQAFIDQIVA